MKKRIPKSKNKKKPPWPKPEGLKPKAIKRKKKPQIKKQKKKHNTLNPTDFNKRE